MFIESPRFPEFIAYWAVGGRGFKTNVIETYGGDETRTAAWSQARGEWEISNAFMSQNVPNAAFNQSALVAFFNVCYGQLFAFRFKDFRDYTESMNNGSGVFTMLTSTTFQMYKRYSYGGLTRDQIIQKPLSPTVAVTGGASPVVDYTTGIVTVASGTPTSWTGSFDIPCRFADDMPKLGPDESTGALLNWQQLKIIEVRDIA